MIAERTFTYDVPRDMTREEFLTKARAYLNNKLLTYAQKNGHTVITEQQDTSELESVSNETGTL
jgi:fructose-specific component phosphotransferase system IIB-like protein